MVEPASAVAGEPIRFGTATARWVLLASILGSGLAGIDATVVNVALPAIGEDLDAEFAQLQWVVTAYTLTLASFILLGGALGDRFGRRRVFVIGVVWFAVASLLCGLVPSVGWLIAARALQGVGGALLTPGSLAMIQASFAQEDRARAIGAWSGLGGVATAIGPFLGGWLIGFASWRWVFLINAPLAIVVVLVALRHVPETRDPTASGRIDVLGAGLGALGLGGVTFAIIEAPARGATAAVIGSAVVGVAAMLGFVAVERRAAHPMLPLSIFKSRQFSAANAVTFLIYAAFGGFFFLLVVHLQVVADFSPLAAGTALLPVTVIMLVGSPRAGQLAQRIGPRLPMTVGPLVCAVAGLLMLRIGPDAAYLTDVLPAAVVLGLGLTILVAPLTATVLAAVETRQAGIASGVNNAVARAAGLMAVAALPVLAGITGDDYTDPSAFADGFRIAIWIAIGLLVVGRRWPPRPSATTCSLRTSSLLGGARCHRPATARWKVPHSPHGWTPVSDRPDPRGLEWDWAAAVRGVLFALPAALVIPTDVTRGVALAVGVLPAALTGLLPTRRARLMTIVLGVLTGLAVFVGAMLAQVPLVAVVGIFGLSVGAALLAARRPFGNVVLVLALPMVGIGFSFTALDDAAALGLVMSLGSLYAYLVSLPWPEFAAPPRPRAVPPKAAMLDYGVRLGAAAALCAAIGFAFDFDHVGWACAAALLVMRPSPQMQQLRSIGRVLSVLAGSLVAITLIRQDPSSIVLGIAAVVAVAAACGTRGSRWYVTSAFTTFLVFVSAAVLAASRCAGAVSRTPRGDAARRWRRVRLRRHDPAHPNPTSETGPTMNVGPVSVGRGQSVSRPAQVPPSRESAPVRPASGPACSATTCAGRCPG